MMSRQHEYVSSKPKVHTHFIQVNRWDLSLVHKLSNIFTRHTYVKSSNWKRSSSRQTLDGHTSLCCPAMSFKNVLRVRFFLRGCSSPLLGLFLCQNSALFEKEHCTFLLCQKKRIKICNRTLSDNKCSYFSAPF